MKFELKESNDIELLDMQLVFEDEDFAINFAKALDELKIGNERDGNIVKGAMSIGEAVYCMHKAGLKDEEAIRRYIEMVESVVVVHMPYILEGLNEYGLGLYDVLEYIMELQGVDGSYLTEGLELIEARKKRVGTGGSDSKGTAKQPPSGPVGHVFPMQVIKNGFLKGLIKLIGDKRVGGVKIKSLKPKDGAVVLWGNPYHDEKGRFASPNNFKSVSFMWNGSKGGRGKAPKQPPCKGHVNNVARNAVVYSKYKVCGPEDRERGDYMPGNQWIGILNKPKGVIKYFNLLNGKSKTFNLKGNKGKKAKEG